MIDLALKNITRQRTRTFLTVLGIVIGIGAIVALGSISEGLNSQIQSSLELNAGKIQVVEKGSSGFIVGFAGSELTEDDVDEIAGVTGVKEVVPQKYEIGRLVPFQGPEWVAVGLEPDKIEFFIGENIEAERGRLLDEGDTEVMLIGSQFAEDWNLDVSDFFTVQETDLEVVGILEETGNSNIDDFFIVPLETIVDIAEDETFPVVYVIPDDVRDTELIADRLEDANEDYDVLTAADAARQASQIVGQVRIFTLGVGAVAALVGGLGIMNTMIMSVLERRREIGVMKAIGATRSQILFHFMTEAFLIAAFGGLIGIGAGFVGSSLLGIVLGFAQGAAVTPGLIVGSFVFSIFLGLAGGFYPSWKASKLDPVEALRYE